MVKCITVATFGIAASFGGLSVGCSKKKTEPPPPPAVDGLAAFGNATRVVIGFDVVKLEASRLVRRAVTSMLARDPELAERVRGIASECQLEPGKNVVKMLVGIGDGPTDLLLVVDGRFEENALTACIQTRLAASGGQLTTLPIGGRTAYKASGGPKSPDPVWLVLGSSRSLIVAGSREWLEIALGKGPRLVDDPTHPSDPAIKAQLEAVLAQTGAKPAAWAIGAVPSAVGAQLAAATGNAVTAPKTMSAQVDFDGGIAARLVAKMNSADHAKALKSLAELQKPLLSAVAHKKGLGQLVAKLEFSTDGDSLIMSFAATEAELSDLMAAVDSTTIDPLKEAPEPVKEVSDHAKPLKAPLDTVKAPEQNPPSPKGSTHPGVSPVNNAVKND